MRWKYFLDISLIESHKNYLTLFRCCRWHSIVTSHPIPNFRKTPKVISPEKLTFTKVVFLDFAIFLNLKILFFQLYNRSGQWHALRIQNLQLLSTNTCKISKKAIYLNAICKRMVVFEFQHEYSNFGAKIILIYSQHILSTVKIKIWKSKLV